MEKIINRIIKGKLLYILFSVLSTVVFSFLILLFSIFLALTFIEKDLLEGQRFITRTEVISLSFWFVVISGALSWIVFFVGKKIRLLKLASIIIVSTWVIGTLITIPIVLSIEDLGSNPENTTSKETCDEQLTLLNTKAATYGILRNDGGHGTGIGISNKGFIATNNHVIENSRTLQVWVDKWVDAKVWEISKENDLAIIKVNVPIDTVQWSSSNKLQEAATVHAIGWPSVLEGDATITKGIVSRKTTVLNKVSIIQTDAPINPGNSGGPLIDKCGVIGITTAKMFWAGYGIPSEGIGFAIASDYAKPILDSMLIGN